jgi:hypothetical protein
LNGTNKPLLDYAEAESNRPREWIEGVIGSDELDGRGWPEFLPDEIRGEWPRLSLDARLIAFAFGFSRFREFEPEESL